MKINKTMKRWIFILIAALAIFLTADLCARERGVKFSGGTDLVSTYVWRGVRESGPAFQPTLTMSAGNFSATAWGSVDFDSTYKEMDLTLAYSLGPVTLSMADLYWTGHADDRYFVFDSRSPHRIEVGASWVVSEKVPVTLSWYTVLFGAADVNDKGERAYASYFEAACPFTVKTVDMKAGVGMVPLERRRDLPHRRPRILRAERLPQCRKIVEDQRDGFDVGRRFHQPDLESGPGRRQLCGRHLLPDVTDGKAGQRSAVSGTDPAFAPRQVQGLHRHERRRGQDLPHAARGPSAARCGRRRPHRLHRNCTAAPKRKPSPKGFRSCPAAGSSTKARSWRRWTRRPSSSPPRDRRRGRTGPTNIEGSENPKRWQDVMQILDAGISVISAVNIQHIEGLNEVVEEITGIEIRERVPDSVLAMADEVVNIDLTADELIARLKAGKIYRPDKIAAALGNFFTQDNLLQLRELALKEVALRVEKKVDSEVTGSETFRRDKLLAVIDSSEKRARRVIRKTARMATHLNAAFTVLYVQGDREADDRIPLARQRYLINNLNLATELGGEARRIRSNAPVESIAGLCREQKINIVCVGRPEFSLFSLLKSAIRLRRLTVRLSRMNIDLFIFS